MRFGDISNISGFSTGSGAPAIPFDALVVSGQVSDDTTFNTAFNTADDHSFVVEFVIPDGEALPGTTQTLFYYGFTSSLSNYMWLRRDTSGSIQIVTRAFNVAQVNYTTNVEAIYPGQTMRLGFTSTSAGLSDVYMNGRRVLFATGKTTKNFNGTFTKLFIGTAPGITSDIDGDFTTKVTYYDGELSRSQMQSVTSVGQAELGIDLDSFADSIGIIGQGQSLIAGSAPVASKTIMPQVALGNLKLINPTGAVGNFSESWYDNGGTSSLIPYFGKGISEVTPLASYMGRVGNNVADQLEKVTILANAARSGSRMLPHWAGDRTDLNVGVGAMTNVGFMTWAIWERIKHMNHIASTVYIVHDQGQGDALDGVAKSVYKASLETQLDYYDFYFPNLHHFIVSLSDFVSPNPATQSEWEDISDARLEVATARSNCTGIDVTDLAPDDADGIHWLNAQQEVVGARVATAIVDHHEA